MKNLLAFEEALARILAAMPVPAAERIPLAQAHGRVLVEPLLSPLDLPLFDNSAMDGYAVRAEDVASATPQSPVRLRVLGKLAPGATFAQEVTPGTAVRLFTGAPLPRGADAVVMQEDTRGEPAQPDQVFILDRAKPWEHVRLRGEDMKQGAPLGAPGDILSAGRLSLLAAVGLSQVSVGCRPVVALVATGSELREAGHPLSPGQIYDSNRLALAAVISRTGAVPRLFPLVTDALAATRLALHEAFAQCDIVVTSGGVSVGEMDFIRQAFQEVGCSLEFWKVAIRPGRPFMFGRWRNKFLFGLPGNPVSALATFLLLVRPALLRCQGAADVSLPTHPGELAEPLVNPGERVHFMRVKVDSTGRVFSAGLQASHALSSLAAANGLVRVPPNTTLPAGTTVRVMRWE